MGFFINQQMQLNYKKILIIIFVIITLGAAYKYYKKYKGAEKLKLANVSIKSDKDISDVSDLVDIFQNGLNLTGFIEVKNLSSEDYTLNQLNVDAFAPTSGARIGEQTNFLTSNIILKSKEITNIPISYNVDIMNALALFKESGVIPQDSTLWQVITHPAKYYDAVNLSKLKVKLKGFIEAEGITLNINQDQYLYEQL